MVGFSEGMLGAKADDLVLVLNGLGIPAQLDVDYPPLKTGLGILRVNLRPKVCPTAC